MGRKSKIPTLFSGEGFMEWSESIKNHLISEVLWSPVEEGMKMAETAEEMKHQVMNDLKARIIIYESLSPHIFMSVLHAKAAKEAWDTLHNTFLVSSKGKFVSQPSHGSVRRSKMKKLSDDESTDDDSSNTLPDVGDDDEVKPLSGDKPSFDLVVTKSALKPRCQLTFPSRLDSMLPSNNLQAVVRFSGQVYKINFFGSSKQKLFGSGWRQLVEDHNLEEGDFLVFEIAKSNDYELEINLQVLKNTLPPELEEEIKKRKLAASKRKAIIDNPDSSASDEDE